MLVALGLTLAPAVPVEWQFLHDAGGYAAVALRPMSPADRFARITSLWGENFAPWRWAFDRPVWYPRPPAAIPLWAMGLGAAVAAAWFAFRALRVRPPEPPERTLRTLLLAGIFAAMALLANAAYATLQMAEYHYRTHILSRMWASLAIAVLAGWAVQRWPRFRVGLLLVPAPLRGPRSLGRPGTPGPLGFNLAAAPERASVDRHRRPALTPGTGIILRSQPTPELYLATEADYLAASWLVLLYDDPAVHCLRLAPDRGTGCRATPEGLDCWHEQQAECLAAGTCAADRFPYEKLVMLDFDNRKGTWQLVYNPQGDPLLGGSGEALAGYRPAARILQRPLTPRQRALLLQPCWLP